MKFTQLMTLLGLQSNTKPCYTQNMKCASGIKSGPQICQPLVILYVLFLGASCQSETPSFPHFTTCTAPLTDNLTFKKETSENTFEILRPLDAIQLIAGFQGGYHVNISVEANSAAEGDNGQLLLNLCQNGQIVGRGREHIVDVSTENGVQTESAYIYLLHNVQPSQLEQSPAEIIGLLIDGEGTHWLGSVPIKSTCCTSLIDPN